VQKKISSLLIGFLSFCLLFCNYKASSEAVATFAPAAAALQVMQINDVYQTLPGEETNKGGLARVATLKKQKLKTNPNTILLLPGDFISPSVASTVFKGKQMIEVLNQTGIDFATVGNHEFDFGLDILLERMQESNWPWLLSNIVDSKTQHTPSEGKAFVIKNYGKLKVGFVGLCLNGEEILPSNLKGKNKTWQITDPKATLAKYLPILKKQKVDLIIALTHQVYADDLKLALEFPELDLIVGGHEHYPITVYVGNTLLSKAGSDARFVANIDFYPAASPDKTKPQFFKAFNLQDVDEKIELDLKAQAVALKYKALLDKNLNEVLGKINEPLEARSAITRSQQTKLGGMIAELMKASLKAEVGLINSGAIRIDKVIPPGSITKRDIISIHPYEDRICKIEMTGELLLRTLNHGVSRLEEKLGRFPQLAGVEYQLSPKNNSQYSVTNVKVNGKNLDSKSKYTLAVSNYILNGGDGYEMLKEAKIIVGEDAGPMLVEELQKLFVN
jgi:5'-nucleotidase